MRIKMEIDDCCIRNNKFDDLLVAIVFFNGDKTVAKNVKILSEKCQSILIINNKSEGASKKIICELAKYNSVHIVNNAKNMGIGYALNQALEYANKSGKKYLLTLDQDSVINIECVSKLLDKIRVPNSRIVSVGPFYAKEKNCDEDVKYLITSGNMIRVDIANGIGGYDDKLFIDCVDIDFSFRLLVNNYRMVRVGGAFMEHKIGDIQKDSPIGIPYLGHDADRCYYNFRNNVYIYRKYFRVLPGRCIKLFLSLCLKFLQIVLIEGNKREKLEQCCRGIKSGFNTYVPKVRGKQY